MIRNILVLGDTHRVANHVTRPVQRYADYQVQMGHGGKNKVIQVGDFGLWDRQRAGVYFLDEVNECLRQTQTKLYAIGGNHEDWPSWDYHIEHSPKTYDGWRMIRSNIFLAPRLHQWSWEGKRFIGIGGAVSIDRDIRTAGVDWFAQEQFPEYLVDIVPNRPFDYCFSHDCSDRTPWGFNLVPDLESQIHRQRIDRVLARCTPKLHFHGHMHHMFDWQNRTGGDVWTQTYGLNCNDHKHAAGVLDIQYDNFRWI